MPSVERELADRLDKGEPLVLATVIRTNGEPPSHTGAKLLINRDGAIAGTLGCSEFDSAALADAPAIAEGWSPQTRTYRHDLGSIDVYLEPYGSPSPLFVFADTPIARALVKWASEVGFRPYLLKGLEGLPPSVEITGGLYVVHTNHDAPDVADVLESMATGWNAHFIGLVGSRRHTGHHLEALRAKGVTEEVIARIQTPVGLDVGARTAEEIALSILAGLVAVRRGGSGGWKSSGQETRGPA
jgi:xanthine dehydrogenase accessory factor